MDTIARIKEQIATNPVLIYMKGTPDQPMCGFSAKAVTCLKEVGEPFAYVNILQDPEIRAELPKYADWPTIFLPRIPAVFGIAFYLNLSFDCRALALSGLSSRQFDLHIHTGGQLQLHQGINRLLYYEIGRASCRERV